MDGQRFDDLTRSVAATTRRGALRLLAAGAVGGLAAMLDRDGAAACRPIRRACSRDGQCCSGRCDPKRRRCDGSCPNGQKPCKGGCIRKSAVCSADPTPPPPPVPGPPGPTGPTGPTGSVGPSGPPPPTNLIDCSGVRVDPLTDEANCGACGRTCPPDGRCVDGDCFCPAGSSLCPGVDRCVDLRTDQANCGACGRFCVSGQTCGAGRCQTEICVGAPTAEICLDRPDPDATECAPECQCGRGADGGTACFDPASIPDRFIFGQCSTNADCLPCDCDPRPGVCIECDGTRVCASSCTPT